jgi:diguanylate cyclase (GGDEF)-like protein/PAS domain S-box-containing protein
MSSPSASKRDRSRLQKLWSAIGVEAVIAIGVAATAVALFFQEPITTRSIAFTSAGAGKSFDAYFYDDRINQGVSVASLTQPLSWRCALVKQFEWSYCGFGMLFDRGHVGRGLNLTGYSTLRVKFDYAGPGHLLRVVFKNHDARYHGHDGTVIDKPIQGDVPLRSGKQEIELKFSDLTVGEWWKDAIAPTPQLARPEFHDVVGLEFVFGPQAAVGHHRINIEELRIERKLISPEAYYAGIALLWLLLIGGLQLHRRRQLARLKRAADLALCESNRLHRTILDTSTDCIVLMNRDGAIEYVNPAGLITFELPPLEEVIGRSWTEFWSREEIFGVDNAFARAAKGETARVRGPGPTALGSQRWWEAIVTPTFDENGALNGFLCVSRDVTAERERSEELKWASEHDALTHLPNRRSFQSRLQAATLRAMQAGEEVGLLLVDLDHFKHVNDSLGHSAGDELLKVLAERLRNCVRSSDFVARIGGDEFAILLENVTSPEILLSVGKQIQDRLRAPVRAGRKSLCASASIGGAMFPTNANTAQDLFKYADTALYELKQNGRGGTKLFDEYMLAEAERTAAQLNVARGALTDKTVVPLYQPKVDIHTGEVVGLEALLRWRDPRRGLQLPGTLEEAFSDYELAAKIGELMQHKVAVDVHRWLAEDVRFGQVSINAAPAEFLRDDYAERLLEILAANEVPPSRIEVEVTEHAFLGRGPEYVARALSVLKEAGATVSLDDFGTGCSSLAHLRDFPVDVVKIDMSFIQQMTEDPEIAAIVAAVIDLASSLSLGVVAEGVETPAQLELLRVMGCRVAQGHLFGRATEASEIPGLMPARKAAA